MEVLSSKTDLELQQSMLAEVAKAANELRCAQRDVDKATNRLNFALVLVNELIARQNPSQKVKFTD